MSNLEKAGWRSQLGAAGSPFLQGALVYIASLPCQRWYPHVLADAERAWNELRRVILFPRSDDVHLLAVEGRSADLGRTEEFAALGPQQAGLLSAYSRVKYSLWREGTVTTICGAGRMPMLILLELLHITRYLGRCNLFV